MHQHSKGRFYCCTNICTIVIKDKGGKSPSGLMKAGVLFATDAQPVVYTASTVPDRIILIITKIRQILKLWSLARQIP
jgi:hypothetical protein